MFLHVFVILSTGKEGCLGPGPGGGWGVWPGGVQAQAWGVCPGGCPGPHPGWRVFRPRPGWGCFPACTEADTPAPSRRLLLRTIRIPLECILVLNMFYILSGWVAFHSSSIPPCSPCTSGENREVDSMGLEKHEKG